MPERLEKLKHWLEAELDFREYTLNPASADASFRRYFRIMHEGASYIVMDAPPDREDSRPFIAISGMLLRAGLNVPAVIDENLEQGFLLLSDLGSRPYLDELNGDTVERLYGDALGALAAIQTCIPDQGALPSYDRDLLLNEMELFREWLRRQASGDGSGQCARSSLYGRGLHAACRQCAAAAASLRAP